MTHADISSPTNWKLLRPWLTALLLADAAGLIAAALAIFRVSRGSGKALILGLSAQSLLLVGLTGLAALGFLALGILTWRGNSWAPKSIAALLKFPAWSIGLLAGIFVASWLAAWTPADYFEGGYYYALRLLPVAGWLAFASATLSVFLLAVQRGVSASNWLEYLRRNRAMVTVAAIALFFSLVVAWLASMRITRITPQEEDFWYGAGVPVLAWQVLTAIVIGLGVAWGEQKLLHNGKKAAVGKIPLDTLVFVSIWIIAGILWARIPPVENFLISPPYPPNFAYYPAADGQRYDVTSQFALIGQGLFNSQAGPSAITNTYFERPLYSAFLFYLHLLTGQNFVLAMALQAALFGVFPALAYLLGKDLHSRGAGATLAVLLTLRGMNGLLAGGILENANQKMFLTDFPTAIGLALVTWLALRWVRQPQRWQLAGWISGCLGLWGLLRPHMVALLPFAALLALVLYFRQKRTLAAISGLMLVSYLAVALPWSQFNGTGVTLVDLYASRVRRVIFERYQNLPLPSPNGSLTPQVQVASAGNFIPQVETPPKSIPAFVLDNFLNNLVTSPLALPATLSNVDLTTLIKHTETYWTPYWNGALSGAAKGFIALNVLLIALGIGAAWQRFKISGLFPLFGMLIYNLLNSLARTSGGRYLVPADWVFILYYVLGLVTVFELGAAWFRVQFTSAETAAQADRIISGKPWLQGLFIVVVLGGLGSLIPLASTLQPMRYARLDKTQLVAKLEPKYLDQLGVSAADMQAFLQQPGAAVMEGRALYPRFIARSFRSQLPGALFQKTLYARMSFTLLGTQGDYPVIVPGTDEWYPLPHAADVIVIGCIHPNYYLDYVDTWAVILEQSGEVHLRKPAAKLACPLPEPVCNQNGGCK